MALALSVEVFAGVPVMELQPRLQEWLQAHSELQVRFIAQSEHVDGEGHFITLSVFYTEPSDRERDLQQRMDAAP